MAQIEGNSSFAFAARFAMIPLESNRETTMALQLRPNCEYCDKDLPPNSIEARICSYECTFCADCTENRLQNVCPNCGGGFLSRGRSGRPRSGGLGFTVRNCRRSANWGVC